MKSTGKALLCITLFVPAIASAQLSVSNILFDADGSDAGREWIELAASEPIDLTGYTLLEGGVHHALKVVQGTSTLNVGEKAIITTHPDTYLSEHTFKGTIFKSSFSLSNTGETIAIADANKKEVAHYSYTAEPKAKTTPAPKPSSVAPRVKAPVAETRVAAVAATTTKNIEHSSMSLLPFFALGAVIVLGVVGVFLAGAPLSESTETLTPAQEFDIE